MVLPGDQGTGRVDAAFEVVEAGGPIEVVAHVVFTRPQQLHRDADDAGDPRGFDHVVVAQAPAEAAADAHHVHVMSASFMESVRATS